MKNKIIISLTTTALFFASCVNENFVEPTLDNCVEPGVSKTKEVAQIYSQATATAQTYTNVVNSVEVPEYIEAIVVSSDEGGNFFKNLYLQPTDGSRGMNVSVDVGNIYTKGFQPGKKVFIKMNGISYANPTNFGRGLILGAAPTENFAVDRIPENKYRNFLFPSCTVVNEEDIIRKIPSLSQALNDNYLNTLVEIDNVQFAENFIGGYYDPNRLDDFDSNVNLTSTGTDRLFVRTSRFANFAGQKVPTGRGKIRGVLTKFNNDFQIILRTERDVKLMSNQRTDYFPPKGATVITYKGSFTENFESYNSGVNTFPSYVNDASVGSKFWSTTSFSGNKYLAMTAFTSPQDQLNKVYFALPVDFTTANSFSFKTQDRFYVGDVLKVYYSKDYTALSDISKATLVDITSNFSIARGTTSGSTVAFVNSGEFNFPAELTGNGFIIFEYTGGANFSPALTTTMHLDDIVVK